MSLFESTGCATAIRAEFQLREHAGAGSRRHRLRLFPAQPSAFDVKYGLTADPARGRRARSPDCGASHAAEHRPDRALLHNGSVNDLTEAVRIMAVSQSGRVLSESPVLEPAVAWLPGERRMVRYRQTPINEAEISDIRRSCGR